MKRANTRYDANYYMYTANALAPEYEEESIPVLKKAVRPAKNKHFIAMTMPNVMRILCVFILAVCLVGQYVYIQGLGYQVGQTKAELERVVSQIEKMKQECAALSDLKTVEARAISGLGMVKPQENVTYLPQNMMNTGEVQATGEAVAVEEKSSIAARLESIFGIFGF